MWAVLVNFDDEAEDPDRMSCSGELTPYNRNNPYNESFMLTGLPEALGCDGSRRVLLIGSTHGTEAGACMFFYVL